MFCGIVDHVGTLKAIEANSNGLRFRIESQFADFVLGESISVDGVCLTVVGFDDATFDCELSPETLDVTVAKTYRKGQELNLERAMRLNDRIGGHLVTGHVDETVLLDRRVDQDGFIEMHFSGFSSEKRAYLIAKGSVTLNGVSLTVNQVDVTVFSVMLIPHTLERTNLSNLETGQRVNVEWDYVAKIIVQNAAVYQKEGHHETCLN